MKVLPFPRPSLCARTVPPCRDQLFNDRKTESYSRPGLHNSGFLPEAVKHVGQRRGGDPLSIVGDNQLHMGIDSFQPNLDLAALGRELDGVGDQVPDDLFQAPGVAGDQADACVDDVGESYRLRLGGGSHGVNSGFHDLR